MTIVALTVTESAVNLLTALQGTTGLLRFQNQGVVPVYRVTATTRPSEQYRLTRGGTGPGRRGKPV